MVFTGASCSVPAITNTNSLGIGVALRNDFFNATVKRLALLLHSKETKSDCCQGNSRENSGRDLNYTIGKHRFLPATAVFAFADDLFSGSFVGHKGEITETTLTIVSNKGTNRVSSGFVKYQRSLTPKNIGKEITKAIKITNRLRYTI